MFVAVLVVLLTVLWVPIGVIASRAHREHNSAMRSLEVREANARRRAVEGSYAPADVDALIGVGEFSSLVGELQSLPCELVSEVACDVHAAVLTYFDSDTGSDVAKETLRKQLAEARERVEALRDKADQKLLDSLTSLQESKVSK